MSGFRPRFFVPVLAGPDDRPPGPGGAVALDAEDSHHALRVLRLHPGDECEVVVGAAVYAATVLPQSAAAGAKTVRLQVGRRLEGPEAGPSYEFPVALVQALARPTAVEWSIEKSTETGVSRILLVPAAGSPRAAGSDSRERVARWTRIAREAAKQSKQPAVPAVEPVSSPTVALTCLRSAGFVSVLLDPEVGESLYEIVRSRTPAEAGVALWVGPESGWTEEERILLSTEGVVSARLGRGVLRTETAGPVAVAVARLALGDW